jgi:hypothetical protein
VVPRLQQRPVWADLAPDDPLLANVRTAMLLDLAFYAQLE